MPSDSVASFLDRAKASRVLPPDQVEDLLGSPGIPQENLASVADFLFDRGVLTRYQAELIRSGRAAEITFAGYPVVDDLGPCPGGHAYRALHPSLRTPVILRRLQPDWVGADRLEEFVRQAQAACPVVHPHLAPLLDAGLEAGEPYITLEPFEGADLQTLVADIGPMPAALAAEYARQVATALAAAQERGVIHGGVRPGVVLVGPLVAMNRPRADGSPRFRPAPTATVKLAELGLYRPGGELPDGGAYTAPEQQAGAPPSAAADVYALGATTFYLLTARAPSSETPLEVLRPDLPADLVTLVQAMMAFDPTGRPALADVENRLATLAGRPPSAASSALSATPSSTLDLGGTGTPATGGAEESSTAAIGQEVAPLTPADESSASVGGDDVSLAAAEEAGADVTPLEAAPEGEAPTGGGEWVATPYHGPDVPAYTPPDYSDWPGGAVVPPEWAPPGAEPAPGWHPAAEEVEAGDGLHASAESAPQTPRTPREERQPSRTWMWLVAGGALNLLAVIGWIYLFAQPGCSGEPERETPQKKPAKQKK